MASRTAVAHAEIPQEVRARLEQLAQANDRSLAAEIRRALRDHVERDHPQEVQQHEESG
jgi:predicted transcriptional regulator